MRRVEYCILYIEYRIEYCTELSFEYIMSFLWSLIGFVCIIWVHNLYPHLVALLRVICYSVFVYSGRVETSSRTESSWVELGSVVWRGSAYTDSWVFLVFRRTSHISWVDRLVPTPKYSSSSRGLDSSVVSAGLTTDVLGSPLVCQSTSAASLFRLLESQSTGHDRHRAGINNIQWLVGVHIGYCSSEFHHDFLVSFGLW